MAEDEQTQGNDEQAAENLRRLMMLVIHKLQNGITEALLHESVFTS